MKMKMNDAEKIAKASAVMTFVEMIRGAYGAGFIDNHPTNYDIYRSAQVHVKDRYGFNADNWNDDLAKESRSDNHDRLAKENAELRAFISEVGGLDMVEAKDRPFVFTRITNEAKQLLNNY